MNGYLGYTVTCDGAFSVFQGKTGTTSSILEECELWLA